MNELQEINKIISMNMLIDMFCITHFKYENYKEKKTFNMSNFPLSTALNN